jgi:ABC-type antimicrobial peptide transport system permease subunit
MIKSYFTSFVKKNPGKTAILIGSISLYFLMVFTTLSLSRSINDIAMLPFKSIGVSTVVQKTGQIPAQMVGAIYPHSNGPIYPDEVNKLQKLDFVQKADTGLYFWYFDSGYFKDVFGVQTIAPIFSVVLKSNLVQGEYRLDNNNILITKDLAQKQGLAIGSSVAFGNESFRVAGILNPNLTGNIVPADIYMDYGVALMLARQSAEMEKLFHTGSQNVVNVVLLSTKPQWQGDIQKVVTGIDKNYLVFSEKTFTSQITDQLKLVSSFGQIAFLILGILLVLAYGFMIVFNQKTREKEIAILRMLGWKMSDLRKQFISENLILILSALLVGNLLSAAAVNVMSHQKVSMGIPWELSAKPHFLPQENNINRVVTSTIPVTYDWRLAVLCSGGFILVLLSINLLLFESIKRIKPNRYLK